MRVDFLPADDAARARELLRRYVDQRVAFYLARDEGQVHEINTVTEKLHADLWSVVVRAVTPKQTAVEALVVSDMNDVLNSRGYTQAAWWNRIPVAAWGLLIAISCSLLFGYGEHRTSSLALVLPLIVSIAFFLIANIDSPRSGVIRVSPQNLIALCNP